MDGRVVHGMNTLGLSKKNLKVLISPLYGIGDVIMTFPAIEILKKSKPNWEISYIALSRNVKKILQLNPYIDKVIYAPLMEISLFEALYFVVREFFRKYDVTINFFPSNRIEYNIFSFLTASQFRIGHRYINQDFRQMNYLKNKTIKEDYNLHCIEENVALLKLLGIRDVRIPPLSLYLTEDLKKLGKQFIRSKKRFMIGVHPGSSRFKNHYNKRWGTNKFLILIKTFPEFDFYIFGSSEEKEEVEFLVKNASNCIPVYDRDIVEVACIISNLNLFVTNDSGLMHLASACGIPVVGIFGPTNPAWVRPWNEPYKIVRLDLECSPCFVYSPKPLQCKYGSDKEFRCLKELEEEKVIDAVKEMLNV